MQESKLRDQSIDFAVDIINLVKDLKSKHETIKCSANAEREVCFAREARLRLVKCLRA